MLREEDGPHRAELEGLHEAQRLRYTADLLLPDIGKSNGLVRPDGRPRHLHGP
jgi:hypothetical protein